MKISRFFLMAVLLISVSCKRNQDENITNKEFHSTEEALIGANRILVRKDREKIMTYISLHNMKMEETPSGLWYAIDRHGSGTRALGNMKVSLSYKVKLLDGTTCYDSDSLGIKQFILGKGGVESGLEEGVLLLREGDRATFILPPHLAHGLPGDGNRIPARSIIVYEVGLIKVDP